MLSVKKNLKQPLKSKQEGNMAKRKDENKEKEASQSRKQLQEELFKQFDLDKDFVEALSNGMAEYDEALQDLKNR